MAKQRGSLDRLVEKAERIIDDVINKHPYAKSITVDLGRFGIEHSDELEDQIRDLYVDPYDPDAWQDMAVTTHGAGRRGADEECFIITLLAQKRENRGDVLHS